MIDSLVQTRSGLDERKWQRKRLIDLSLLEADLENVIFRNHELLCLERLGLIVDRIQLVQQAAATDLMGGSKYPDLMFLTDRGDVGIVEVKRFGNPELRGRHVISQVLDYGATLCSLSEPQQASLLSKANPPAKSLEELATELVGDSSRARWIAKSYRDRLRHAQLHYIIVCDESPQGLAEWIRAASRNDATDYQISVLEVSPFVVEGQESDILWLSQPVARTETIHRTTVRVIRDDESGELTVTVASDSPESIAERVESDQPRENFTERLLKKSLEQLSGEVGIREASIRSALEKAHAAGLRKDWTWALEQFAEPGRRVDSYLRGGDKSGLLEGRFGLNIAKPHRPGIFSGYYFSSVDHKVEPVFAEKGGDFTVILEVYSHWGKKVDFWDSPEYEHLKARLRANPEGWVVSLGSNVWHPLLLHRSMADVIRGAETEEDIVERWMRHAEEGIQTLLAGNELSDLKERLQSQDEIE